MRIRFAWGVAVAAALAGCGGSSVPSLSAFKAGFAAQRTSHKQFGVSLGTAIRTAPNRSDAELATEFQQLSTKAVYEARQLRRLNPPRSYRAQLDRITAGFGTVGTDLHTISAAAGADAVSNARTATIKLINDVERVKSVDDSLAARLRIRQS